MNEIFKIDGQLFEKMVIGGVLNLKANMNEVNDLNVFPIPDGDTGDNMFMTINGGVSYIKSVVENSLCLKAQALSKGMMLNARGNSGVILSQLFSGISKGLVDLEEASINEFGLALKQGVAQAYSAVVEPVEGTILTVAREAVEYANNNINENSTINSYIEDYIYEMKQSLDRTPDLLATLKEAGVIDSGGAGLLYIALGFKDVLDGKEIKDVDIETNQYKQIDLSKFNEDSVMEFGYCTELLLQLQNIKVNPYEFNEQIIIDYLNTIGESIVVFKTGTIIKLHVHTLQPYKVLEFCQQFGEFLTIKIENMTLQHAETIAKEENKPAKNKAKKQFGVVTVASGSGLINAFYEMGVDVVIDGGQCKNPSTQQFLDAFDECNAEYIYVLPNNSNIILTAKEAKELYNDANIYVVETKDFGQAYSALSMLDTASKDPDVIYESLNESMEYAITGMITKSIRDANINNVDIHEGDYIGFCNKTMHVSNTSKLDAYYGLIKKLVNDEASFIINVFGKDVTEEEKELVNKYLQEIYPMLEVYTIEGQQEVYDFVIIIE